MKGLEVMEVLIFPATHCEEKVAEWSDSDKCERSLNDPTQATMTGSQLNIGCESVTFSFAIKCISMLCDLADRT